MKGTVKPKNWEKPEERDPSGRFGRNAEPFLLFELAREPSYGYDLIRRLADHGFRRAVTEPGVVYKRSEERRVGKECRL